MNIAVWTDNDLDGAGSALAIFYVYKDVAKNISYFETNERELPGTLRAWLDNNYELYDKIYILDQVIPESIVKFVDRGKVVIIDHHPEHCEVKERYKFAKAIIEKETSCTKLILNKFFKALSSKITPQIIELLNIVDDYDTYELKFSNTLKLNAIYSTYNKPHVDKFIDNFKDGIRDFTQLEINSITLYLKKVKHIIDTAEIYAGKIKDYTVVSCMTNYAINEVAHFLLKKYNKDICIIVNPDTKGVSFRKNKQSAIKLNNLAKILCKGGGHENAAGGTITETFLNITKTFYKCT